MASCGVSPTSRSNLPTLDIFHFSDMASSFCNFLLWKGFRWFLSLPPIRRKASELHFGVARHGEAVEAVGDDSQAGRDEQRFSVGLGAKRFEDSVKSGGLVRVRTTRRDDD